MERFNKTTKGYKFDKVIFWSAISIVFLVLVSQFMVYGFKYKPYVKCIGPGACENPFYNKESYGCSFALGMKKCDIDKEAWFDLEYLKPGTYGTKPIDNGSFILFTVGILLLALSLNHFLWNKGKKFHLNIFDKFDKMEED